MDVTLRPLAESDLHWRWNWEHNVPDAEWKRWDAPYFHRGETPLSWPDFRARTEPGGAHRRVIELEAEPVGLVSRAEEEPSGDGWWDLGIVIYDPARRGGGLGTRALAAWIDDTVATTNAHVLTLTTWGGNVRMLAVAARLGFTECARIPEARSWAGKRYDSIKLALLRRDYRPGSISPR